MKFLKQLPLLALLAILAFSSCQKEEILTTEVEVPTITPTNTKANGLMARAAYGTDGLDLGCVSIDYPFSLLLLDSSTVEITSEEEMVEAFGDEDNFPIDFVYPLDITDEDGESSMVFDADELSDIFVGCIPDDGWGDDDYEWDFPAWEINFDNSCYQLVYPVTLLDMDGDAVVANSKSELISYLADGNIYSFAFPLELEHEDGTTETADDAEDLFELLAECSPNPGPGGCGIGTFACYELGYPATLLLVDGSTAVVNDDDEFAAVVVSGNWAGFEYPLTLIDEDGEEIVVNNEDELDEALLACSGFGDGPVVVLGDYVCYDIVFPFSVTDLSTGDVITFNSSEEWLDFQYGSPAGPPPYELVFPITFIHTVTGEETVVNNEEELEEAIDACFGGNGGNGGGSNPEFGEFLCYDFVYPFSVTNLDTGDVTTFGDADAWNTFLAANGPNGPSPFDFVYPLSLTEVETGNEVTVNDEDELIEALEECW